MTLSKRELFASGVQHIDKFCRVNHLVSPRVDVADGASWMFSACAYYRPTYISICPDACANIGEYGRQWSYPGYSTDRTPYGVLAHEIGHHVDYTRSEVKSRYYGDYSVKVRTASRGEQQLTSYCPNDAEWFAEMFRLFVTNPDLLRILRPKTYAIIESEYEPIVTDRWDEVLRDAPTRTIQAATNAVVKAQKKAERLSRV